MADLNTLQSTFQHYLEHGDEEITQHIVNTHDALAEHRLAAYYNAYRARLIEALAFDYPAVQTLIGEDKFAYLVLNYLKVYPSHYPSVRWVGKDLTTFIKQQDAFESQAFLAELALFEWSQSLAFDGSDQATLFQLEDMRFPAEEWPNLCFKVIPTLIHLDLKFNTSQYWQAVNDGAELPAVTEEKHSTRWIVWRNGLNPHWRSLEVHEAWALEQALAGKNFGEICDGLAEWVDAEHIAITAAGFLKQWISDQLLVSVSQ